MSIQLCCPELKKSVAEAKDRIAECPFWKDQSRRSNPYEVVHMYDPDNRISRAYYKMQELQAEFTDLVRPGQTKSVVCLCEAPGGFIESILQTVPQGCRVITNSHSETGINFSNKIRNDARIAIVTGIDGDITNKATVDAVVKASKGAADLVTADGSCDATVDYHGQEKLNLSIFRGEIDTALGSLKTGGAFVIKMFDLHCIASERLVRELYEWFEKVSIVKPRTSRPCNSEKYVVCLNKRESPEPVRVTEFLDELKSTNDRLCKTQLKALNAALSVSPWKYPALERDQADASSSLMASIR